MGKGRTPCCEKERVKKGPWSQHEDFILISFIQRHGHSNWRLLPKLAGLARCGKSCRLRWVNYLRPELKRGSLTPDEEDTIIRLQSILGNKWSKIASHLPGRTDNEIKNIWNTHLKKRSKTNLTVNTTQDHEEEEDNEAAAALIRYDESEHNINHVDGQGITCLVDDLWDSLLLDEAGNLQHDQEAVANQQTEEAISDNIDGSSLKMDNNMERYLEIMAWPSSPSGTGTGTCYSFPGY
ncbi:hypothetical protein V2J09_018635 [Rumex salicifolius]